MSENQVYIDGLHSGLKLCDVVMALDAGLKVERCSINESGEAVSWVEITKQTRDIDQFGPTRYRVLVPDDEGIPPRLLSMLDFQNEVGEAL